MNIFDLKIHFCALTNGKIFHERRAKNEYIFFIFLAYGEGKDDENFWFREGTQCLLIFMNFFLTNLYFSNFGF